TTLLSAKRVQFVMVRDVEDAVYCPATRHRCRHLPSRCSSCARAFSSAFSRSSCSGARACGTRTSIRMQSSMVTLLTRLRSLIWPSDPRRYCLSHKLVPEPCAVGLDEPRRRMWKMDWQNIFAGPGDLGEKLSPRPRGLRRIPVEDRRPIGL